MKFFLLIGGTCGFLLAFGAGLLAGNEIMIVLRDGAIGCMAGALLMRGFSAVYLMSIKELAAERAKARVHKHEASTN
ncbi:MAG: hypothetical protein PHQ12_11895 [Chthoniobacteraceae bacterium]|nr:hypothetical protein [Chthoniobacteraceae bacterium]